jgi:hypothetical protein
MAHPHEKLVVILIGWSHGENGNNKWQHSSSFNSGKHTNQLSLNTTTYYYTRKILQTTHKIWQRIHNLYHTPHILNYLEITRRGNMRLRLNADQSRNKQKNQDQVNFCCHQIENLQHQLLNRDFHLGCNTVSWGGFDKYDHAKNEIKSNFCKK